MGACQSQQQVKTKTKKQWRIIQSETGPAKLTKTPINKNNPQQKLKQTIYEYFDKFDTNGDGRLCKEELTKFLVTLSKNRM